MQSSEFCAGDVQPPLPIPEQTLICGKCGKSFAGTIGFVSHCYRACGEIPVIREGWSSAFIAWCL
eukprot:1457387-Lingulodinium_polyedra.AAC.1